jgi:hypothetical protein
MQHSFVRMKFVTCDSSLFVSVKAHPTTTNQKKIPVLVKKVSRDFVLCRDVESTSFVGAINVLGLSVVVIGRF